MAKKKTVRSKTLDERIVAFFKDQVKQAEYQADDVSMPCGDYDNNYEEFQDLVGELAALNQKTKEFQVNLTKEDERTIKDEIDGWCLSGAAKASIRKALKL